MAGKWLGENYALTQAASNSGVTQMVSAREWYGRVRVLCDKFDLAVDNASTALALNDTIRMGRIPIGAKIHSFVLISAAMANSCAVNAGWTYEIPNNQNIIPASDPSNVDTGVADVDNLTGFLSASSISSAVTTSMTSVANAAGEGYVTIDAADVILTVTTAGTATTGAIQTRLLFSVD